MRQRCGGSSRLKASVASSSWLMQQLLVEESVRSWLVTMKLNLRIKLPVCSFTNPFKPYLPEQMINSLVWFPTKVLVWRDGLRLSLTLTKYMKKPMGLISYRLAYRKLSRRLSLVISSSDLKISICLFVSRPALYTHDQSSSIFIEWSQAAASDHVKYIIYLHTDVNWEESRVASDIMSWYFGKTLDKSSRLVGQDNSAVSSKCQRLAVFW